MNPDEIERISRLEGLAVLYPQTAAETDARLHGRGALSAIRKAASFPRLLLALGVGLLAVCMTLVFAPVPNGLEQRVSAMLRPYAKTLNSWLPAGAWQAAPAQTEILNAPVASGQAVAPAIKPGSLPVVVYGDRLKIVFFETTGVQLGGSGTDENRAVAAVFPRTDLSGEFEVDGAGTINVPRLGVFMAAGQSVAALQANLTAAFQATIGRSSDVHVAIIDRPPVYVLGAVRSSGALKYLPGMVVLQALAAVGGSENAADTSQAIEGVRELELLRQTQEKLDRLLVIEARLNALKDDAKSLSLPAELRSHLTGSQHDYLGTVITDEAAALVSERQNYQQRLMLADKQVGVVHAELAAQQSRAAQLKVLQTRKEDKLRELQQVAGRGSVTEYRLFDASAEASDAAAREQDARVAIAQAERRLVEAESVRAGMILDHGIGIARDLAKTREDIEDCRHALVSLRAVVKLLPAASLLAADDGQLALHIKRRTAAGLALIPATEATALLPGDVILVGADRNDVESPDTR